MPCAETWAPHSWEGQLPRSLVHPHRPCEAPSSLGGARVVPRRRNKPRVGSLLWAQMPSRALAQKQVHKDHTAAPWHTVWHAPALSTQMGPAFLQERQVQGLPVQLWGSPLTAKLRPQDPRLEAEALLVGDPLKLQWTLKDCGDCSSAAAQETPGARTVAQAGPSPLRLPAHGR